MAKDSPIDLSKLSVEALARLSVMIEQDGDSGLRGHLLGVIGRPETARGARGFSAPVVPDRWSQIHVLDRLEEAYKTLAGLPMKTFNLGTAWPAIQQQKLSILDQIEMLGTGELEQLHEDRNRVRLPATSTQVSRMEQALGWPFEYLGDMPELARALSLRCFWASMGADIKKRCERRGIDHAGFNADWQAALAIVTGALIARKVPVS